MHQLSQTQKRGFLYLALIVIIVVMIVFWPAPKRVDDNSMIDTAVAVEDTMIMKSVMYGGAKKTTSTYHKREKHDHQPRRQLPYNPTTAQQMTLPDIAHDSTTIHRPKKEKAPLMVELNSADTTRLMQLSGVGKRRALHIIKYRDNLGGFTQKEQLLDVFSFDEEVYHRVADHVYVDTALMPRIKINSVGIKTLQRHPYLDYNQAYAIISWRNKGHLYCSADDLRLVSLLDDETVAKILPHLDFSLPKSEDSTAQPTAEATKNDTIEKPSLLDNDH